MAKQFPALSSAHSEFIAAQPIFFVATAVADGRINLSPKGMDSLRILGPNRILWLNTTGSGNETAAHVLKDSRMTIMWCAFSGAPLILRVYGSARTIYPDHPEWEALYRQVPSIAGARQLFDVEVDMVMTSCGMGVPLMDFQEERTALKDWSKRLGEEGLEEYWQKKNTVSLDGLSTGITP